MHNNTLRRVSTHASTTTTSSRITPSIHTRRSTDSRILEQVLQDGDEIGPGRFLLDQPISVVHARSELVPNLRVLRKLATGSYAVVYLVQEIIQPTTASNFLNLSEDEDSPPLTPAAAAAPAQGRLFALKCLEKHAQDQDAQLLEATIHQSLPVHQNIVTLWSTLETESYLLLVLDYVPGEDLFYFLEQFRDYDESHLDRDPSSPTSSAPTSTAGLAWLEPSQLLSYHRLRLVASMFAQMCEAVAHCHRHGVFHRDIKPENFMVTDTRIQDPVTGEYKRSVIVKLTDFGLATRDPESGDMDCECRNFITPMYATAPADVWSLGIVLLNMLYHANPWMSSAFGACQSFDSFLREPIRFFMERFPGMTPAVAEFFARRVFCLLEVPPTMDNTGNTSPLSPHYANNVGRRITAE
ncbi:4221_t:CDS:2, partial [Acaulospora colombiana]